MKISSISTAAAILLLGRQVQARPSHEAEKELPPDQANMLAKFLQIAKGIYPDVHKPWLFKEHPLMCSITMETKNGGHCKAAVECTEGGRSTFDLKGVAQNFCHVGGRQFWSDPRIGNFSITYSKKDGPGEGQGLTTPIVQVEQIGNWLEMPVTALAKETYKNEGCQHRYYDTTTKDCGAGPFVCHFNYENEDIRKIKTSRTKKWECAIPLMGKGNSKSNLDSA